MRENSTVRRVPAGAPQTRRSPSGVLEGRGQGGGIDKVRLLVLPRPRRGLTGVVVDRGQGGGVDICAGAPQTREGPVGCAGGQVPALREAEPGGVKERWKPTQRR